MRRGAVFTLLGLVLAVPAKAQRAAGTLAPHASGLAVHSGSVGQGSVSNGSFSQRGNGRFPGGAFFSNSFRFRHDHHFGEFLGPVFFADYGLLSSDYGPYGYEQAYPEQTSQSAAVVILQRSDEPRSHLVLPAQPRVIEVPGAADSTRAKTLPPTVFILANGERLEARQFMLTESNLFVTVGGRQRTIPVDRLDIDATVSANRERGIDLLLPDRNQVFLSF